MVFPEHQADGLCFWRAERIPIATEAIIADLLEVTDRSGIIPHRQAAILQNLQLISEAFPVCPRHAMPPIRQP